jgi:hypothetical protein
MNLKVPLDTTGLSILVKYFVCSNLQEIKVSSTSSYFKAKGNCLLQQINDDEYSVILGCATSEIPTAGDTDNITVTVIDQGAFSYRSNLETISIPASVKEIATLAFCNCTALSNITFEQGSQLSSIGIQAFLGCTSLSTIKFPESLRQIQTEAFKGCIKLGIGMNAEVIALDIPSNIDLIATRAFANCGLTRVNLLSPTIISTVGSYVFVNNNKNLAIYSYVFPTASQINSQSGTDLVTGYWKNTWRYKSTAGAAEYTTRVLN